MSVRGELEGLIQEARDRVEAADDGEARLALREAFYHDYGHGTPLAPLGYGRSELDFMRWEVDRGVLHPTEGSPWWRKVNGRFLFFSELGRLCHERLSSPHVGLPNPAALWVDYIRRPSSVSWYRAHNASIVVGYLESRAEARQECKAEQQFMNVVLYRLLFAQAIVEFVQNEDWLSLLTPLDETELVGPRGFAVRLLVRMPDFYPKHYPLNADDILSVLHRGMDPLDYAVSVLDLILVRPRLTELYDQASRWNRELELRTLVHDGSPVYPNRREPIIEDPEVWVEFGEALEAWWDALWRSR